MAWETKFAAGDNHAVVKPEKIVQVGVEALEQSFVVPAVFQREGLDKFKGGKGDGYTVTVDGVLPFRTFGWRADRAVTEVQFDEYKERKLTVTFGDDIYNGVKLTDEQNTMDLIGWAKLAAKQVEAIGRGLEYEATDYLHAAPYEVVVTLDQANLRSSLIKLRGVMNKLRVQGPRTILCETDLETALLEDEKLNLAQNVGEGEAVSALREATLGRRYGFNFVVAEELNAMSVAMVQSAFVMVTGAPEVPQSVPFGASASANGVSLRWIRDYDSTKFQDRSIFNTYKGFREVTDPLIGRDDVTGDTWVTQDNHFVRAVKVVLGAAWDVELANDELADVTGLTSTDGINDGS